MSIINFFKKPAQPKAISYFELYKFTSCMDKFIILLASLFSILTGILYSTPVIYLGNIMNAFVNYAVISSTKNITKVELKKAQVSFYNSFESFLVIMLLFGASAFLLSYMATVLYHYSSHKQIFNIRKLFFASIINQDISWYDTYQTGDFVTTTTEDSMRIQEGVGEKVSFFLFFNSVFATGFIISISLGWKLALVSFVSSPLAIIFMRFTARIQKRLTKNEFEAYGTSGAIAKEALGAIKTVIAFEGQEIENDRYHQNLLGTETNNIKRSIFSATICGITWLNIYCTLALCFWYGLELVLHDKNVPANEVYYTTSNVITIFFATFQGNYFLGQSVPYYDIFTTAQKAAYEMFKIIDHSPIINAAKHNGIVPENILGNVEFSNMYFEYPSRPDIKVLQGLNLKIQAGETIALVGSSGCGKSTCMQLIQRFYDPTLGNVTLDGHDLLTLNLAWLRSHLGVVGQEPDIFATTIAENIRYGNQTATQEEIEACSKKANAHSFISMLPDGYDSLVGERGAQLSGGQKQRIAIARALIKSPTILILDEATSALDTNSEAMVLAGLNSYKIEKNATIIIVTHRLSPIKNVDRIVVLSKGIIVEEGKHDNLMNLKGYYYSLVTKQSKTSEILKTNCPKPNFLNGGISQDVINIQMREDADECDKKEFSRINAFINVIKLNRPEWIQLTIGSIASIINGAIFPIFTMCYANILDVYVLSHDNEKYIRSKLESFCVITVIIAFISGIALFLQLHMFGVAGQKLLTRIRSKMFSSMLNQELGWFDMQDNGVGALCTRLSVDAAHVQDIFGQSIAMALNTTSALCVALGFALIFEWRIALVTLSLIPFLSISIYFNQKITNANAEKTNKLFEKSGKFSVEVISNIRTVASLGCEELFKDKYTKDATNYYNSIKNSGHIYAISVGISRTWIYFIYAISYYYGGLLVVKENLHYTNVFKVTEPLITAAISIGVAMSFIPNILRGIAACKNVSETINGIPKIRNTEFSRTIELKNRSVRYSNVEFSYPCRPNVKVLQQLNLQVNQGETIALVGMSGCGKSTIIQLLQRFYEPNNGLINLDDSNIRDMTIQCLRSNLGIVSQEPVLFNRTISENIAYGANNRIIHHTEILEAAKIANIHNFIASLPNGYETKIGEKGTQLSGGQKQRIAIARALIRNPKILLLDEATSALDNESEKVVQKALDDAKEGRTTIIITHRLTTIENAHLICVINKGRIEEMGTHNELLRKGGIYYELYQLQM